MPVALHVRDTGSGRAVVLLHAFPLSSAMWLAQREGLSGEHRVVTPDQRGFGGSPLGDDPPSLDAAADDVAVLLDQLAIDRVVLGGLSMGGYVAMAFLRRHADRVAALILADTKATADPPQARENRERIAAAVVDDPASMVLVDEVLPTLLGDTTVAERPLVTGRVKALVQAAPGPAVAWAQRAMAARPDSFETLHTVSVPTLVLVGAEDTLSPVDDAQAMAEAVTGARLEILPRAGHLSALECPEDFNAAVLRFLATLPD
ncbi:MAG TPA: alpha/beta fold hydrolase [Mycobacteriales bacterium]|nr:alpha/beta fold hydrolase [Mycobacteriales bacterium]